MHGALSGRSKQDIDKIVSAFGPLAEHGTLDADLRDELTDSEYAKVKSLIATALAERHRNDAGGALEARKKRGIETAQQLYEAMRGWGTDETQLLNAIQGRSPRELIEIARQYKAISGRDMVADLRDELSGSDLRQALDSAGVEWHPGDGPEPEIGVLQQQLNAVGASPMLRITGIWGPDTTAAITAFQTSHAPLPTSGQLTLDTWLKLDDLAPRVAVSGRVVSENQAPAEAEGRRSAGRSTRP